MNLLQVLRWLVETWPQHQSVTPTTPEEIWRRQRQVVLGPAEWQLITMLAATVACTAGETGDPEALLAWWFSIYGTPERNVRRQRAIDALHQSSTSDPVPVGPVFGFDDPDTGFDQSRWDYPMQRPEQVGELDTITQRWLCRLAKFGRHGVFTVTGMIDDNEAPLGRKVTLGREIWRPDYVRLNFCRNVIELTNGQTIYGAEATLTPYQRSDVPPHDGPEAMLAEDPALPASPTATSPPPIRSRAEAQVAYAERVEGERASTGYPPTLPNDYDWARMQRPFHVTQPMIDEWRAKYLTPEERRGGRHRRPN